MNDQERADFIKMANEYTEKLSKDRNLARGFLVRAGIYTKAGKLSKHYRNFPKV